MNKAITLLLIISTSLSFGQNKYNFVQSIMEYNFDKALTVGNILDEKLVIPFHHIIVQFKKNSGQNKFEDLSIINSLVGEESTILSKIPNDEWIYYYSKGLYYLHNDIGSGKTFTLLKRAFEKIPEEDLDYKKLVLLTFCELYAKEAVQSNTEYLSYLDDYSDLVDSNIDQFWQEYHNNKYQLKILDLPIDDINEAFNSFSSLIKKNNFSKELLLFYNYTKAINYQINQEPEKAFRNFQKVIDTGKNKPYFNYFVFTSLIHQTKYYSQFSFKDKARETLKKSRRFWDQSDSLRSKFLDHRFSALNYYEPFKIYDTAFINLKTSIADEYSLDFRTNTLKNSEQNVLLQTAQKEKQILEEQAQKKRNQNIALGLGGTLVLGSIIAILIYRNTKRKQRIAEQEKELQIQKTTTLLKEQEINAINAMVDGQEKERIRIAQDLHDNLGGNLAAIKMHIGNLQNNLGKSKNPQDLLDKSNLLIAEAYKSVRSLAHERHSGVMAKDGLLPAIRKLVTNVSAANYLKVTVQDFGLESRLHNDLEITLFRIVQELVTNIIKHAQATEATISLTQHEEELNIMVEDNGKGFKAGRLVQKEGMGLGSIERRIEHLEGTLEVDSTPGKGTNIIIDIPI